MSKERTQGQPGFIQGLCLPGLGKVLLILPAGTSPLLGRPVVGRLWVLIGSREVRRVTWETALGTGTVASGLGRPPSEWHLGGSEIGGTTFLSEAWNC